MRSIQELQRLTRFLDIHKFQLEQKLFMNYEQYMETSEWLKGLSGITIELAEQRRKAIQSVNTGGK